MREEFEDCDLSESTFWGVNLQNVMFRDVDLSGSVFFHTEWRSVSLDGVVDGLVVNGVDVTDYVNSNDRWYPLRTELSPPTAEGMRSTWSALCAEWDDLLGRIFVAGSEVVLASVNGEWSLRDTLRHLLFAMDKWFTWPILNGREFSAMALPNTGSQGRDWPGIHRDADPSFEEVLAERARKSAIFGNYLEMLDLESLPAESEVIENGTVPTVMCFHVVLEEEFEHLRYATRDLAALRP